MAKKEAKPKKRGPAETRLVIRGSFEKATKRALRKRAKPATKRSKTKDE